VPHPGGHDDLVLLRERCHPAPYPGLREIADLRFEQFGQALALDHGPGRQPGQHTRGEHVKPYKRVVERQPEGYQEQDIGDRNAGKYGNPVDRQRRREPKVIQLVKPLFDSPDVRIGGQVHLTALLSDE
jgi:hypothetical protein